MKRGQDKIGLVRLLGCRCRCGHEWLPRHAHEKPRVGPKCKSPNWDREKMRRAAAKADVPSGS